MLWRIPADTHEEVPQHAPQTGDAKKFHIVGEATLESRNEAGSGIVADLT